jgi:hypothetical protein
MIVAALASLTDRSPFASRSGGFQPPWFSQQDVRQTGQAAK